MWNVAHDPKRTSDLHPNLFDYLPTRWCLGSALLLPAVDLSTFARKGHDDSSLGLFG